MEERERAILALERDFWLEGGGDPEYWRRHFADDGLIVLSSGMMGKDEVVSVMEAERGWDAVDFDDVRWVHSASTSILGYQARARSAGSGEIDYQAMIASGYRKDDDGWRLVFHQQTPLV
ncbi:MAG: hypothetical protein FWJ92_01145 [Actinomycetes bacterium]|jgi:ketosteroid isomerase-like protein|nr:nuclear transport factor 2 family protein [Acidimicrobiia bacterium]